MRPLQREGIELWFDDDIKAGGELDPEIRRALRRSRVFVALVSPDYLASHYCFEREYRYALGRRQRGTMHVIAAVIRSCGWKNTRMARYKALPRDGKPANEQSSRDKAYEDIVRGIREVVKAVLAEDAPKQSAKKRVGSRGAGKPPKKASRKGSLLSRR